MNAVQAPSLRVAIIGGGPSGFFLAGLFIKEFPDVEVHILEREAMPYGLVRYGIAPDHQHTKKVSKVFEKTGNDPRVHLHALVDVGSTVSFQALREAADLVIVTTGHDQARPLDIPGEDRCIAALDWVNWYNCHPQHSDRPFRWQGETAAVIGNGNVALDIVRLLAKSPEALAETDINPVALAAFKAQPIKQLVVLGRRGPAQASFKLPEVKELMAMEDLDLRVQAKDLEFSDSCTEELAQPENREHARVVELFKEIARRAPRPDARCCVDFQFLRSPVAISERDGRLELELGMNTLEGPAGSQHSKATGRVETLLADLIIAAVGYRGSAIDGLPYDERQGRVPTEKHRVVDEQGVALAGVYASGWIKTGPKGLVGNSRQDAAETFKQIQADLAQGMIAPGAAKTPFVDLFSGLDTPPITWEEWQRLDAEEVARGAALQKNREKFCNKTSALAYLR